ncbi:hypothetical protein HY639_00515 [Candidatus Woesearchaeota archaeon]|nr:hypothetical protein [Candidatus Woesearchaeota archaeon]
MNLEQIIRKEIPWTDVSHTGKQLAWTYSGAHDLYLEGRLLAVTRQSLRVALTGTQESDLVFTEYDAPTKTYSIYIRCPHSSPQMLKATYFSSPLSTENIMVYEYEHQLLRRRK